MYSIRWSQSMLHPLLRTTRIVSRGMNLHDEKERERERERRAGRTWNNVKNPEAEVGVFVTLECIITLRGRINKRDRRCVSRLHTQTSVHYVSQIRVIAFQSQTIYSRPKNFESLFFSRIKYNHFQIYSHCRFSPLGFSGRFFSRKVNIIISKV